MNNSENKAKSDGGNITVITLAALLVISVLLNVALIFSLAFPHDNSVSLSLMPGTLKNQTLPQNTEIQGWFEVKGLKNLSEDMLSFNSSNPNVATISLDKISAGKYVYYKIRTLSAGEALLSVSCNKENISTDPIHITVSQNSVPVSVASPLTDTVDSSNESPSEQSSEIFTYVINVKSGKFHYDSCKGVKTMSNDNKILFTGTKAEALNQGYSPCGTCKP